MVEFLGPTRLRSAEALPKRTFFGQTFEVDPQIHVWKRDLTLDDGVKGIYPFNIWSSRLLKDPMLAPIVATLPSDTSISLGSGFAGVMLSSQQLTDVRQSSRDLRDFVRA